MGLKKNLILKKRCNQFYFNKVLLRAFCKTLRMGGILQWGSSNNCTFCAMTTKLVDVSVYFPSLHQPMCHQPSPRTEIIITKYVFFLSFLFPQPVTSRHCFTTVSDFHFYPRAVLLCSVDSKCHVETKQTLLTLLDSVFLLT